MAVINEPVIGTQQNDTILNNKNGVTIMTGGDGDDSYIIENISKSWTQISDGNYTMDEYNKPSALISGLSIRDIPNTGSDKVVIKNVNANDLTLFFDVAIAENKYDKTSMPDDGLYIIKKSGINAVINQYNKAMNATNEEAFIKAMPSTNGVEIPYYFGDNNNMQENGEMGENAGANYIKTIQTMDKNGIVKTLDVDAFMANVRPKVEEFLLLNGFKTASEVLFGNNVKVRNNLINVYKNTMINLSIEGTNNNDVIIGENGDDTINGGKGNDIIKGQKGNDTVIGGEGDDKLYGVEGNNTFIFGKNAGNDIVYSGKGNDTLKFTDASFNELEFCAKGNDLVIKFASEDSKLNTVTIFGYFRNPKINSIKTIIDKTGSIYNVLENIEKGNVTLYIDAINNERPNSIKGTKYDDEITGGVKNDVIKAGYGNDTIIGGKGNDRLYGEYGNNTFVFAKGDGQDIIYSGKGSDTIEFLDIAEFKTNGVKNILFSANGNNLIIKYGKNYEDSVTIVNYLKNPDISSIKNIKFGNTGDVQSIKQLLGENPFEFDGIDGRNNSIKGTNSADIIRGSAPVLNAKGQMVGGNDNINAGGGNDTIYGESGNDIIHGGDGDDIIYGGEGNDRLYGDNGNNTFVFNNGDGNDLVYSGKIGKANDALYFEDVNFDDLKFSAKGNNLVIRYGENYKDSVEIVNYLKNPAQSTIESIVAKDTTEAKNLYDMVANGDIQIKLNGIDGKNNTIRGVTYLVNIINGADPVLNAKGKIIGGNDNIIGGNQNDILNGGAGNDIIKGQKGNDIIIGGKGNDKLYGVEGNNTFVFNNGDGNDIVYSGKGSDTLQFKDSLEDNLNFSAKGNDLIIQYGTNYEDSVTIAGYLNKMTELSGFSNSSVKSIEFKDGSKKTMQELLEGKSLVFKGINGKNNSLKGTNFNDIIYGTNPILNTKNQWMGGNDTIKGGRGNDIIIGGKGNDKLYGEDGHNTFIFKEGDGQDMVFMGKGSDTLVFDPAFKGNLIFDKSGNNLVIKYGEKGDSVTISNYFNSKYISIKNLAFGSFENGELSIQDTSELSVHIVQGKYKENVFGYGNDVPDYLKVSGYYHHQTFGSPNNPINSLIVGTSKGYNYLQGNNGDDIIYSQTKDMDRIEAGAGDDTMYIQSKFSIAIGGAGDDTYIVKSLANQTVILDTTGYDTLKIQDSTKNMKMIFDVAIDGNGNIINSSADNDGLYILNNTTYKKAASTGNLDVASGIEVDDFAKVSNSSYRTSVKKIEAKDGSYLTMDDIDAIRQDIASWLNTNGYNSALEVLYDGSKTDINNLLSIYQNIENQWHKN